MELKYLNTVKTILETGSFQNAAKKLNYTQSTVTFQIQQLEQELGMKLFEKIGRKMVLTQAGTEILPYIESVLETIEKITNYGKSMQQLTGTLKVAIPESLLVYKMQDVITAFRREAPHVQLSLQILNCYQICDALARGSVDVGLHYRIEPNPALITERIAAFPFVPVGSPDLTKNEQDFILPAQTKHLTLLYGDRDSFYYHVFDEYLKAKGIDCDDRLLIQSIEAIKLSAMSNLGIAFLPRFCVEKELAQKRLIELPADMPASCIDAVISYHKNKWISPAMELFIRLVKEHLL